MAGLDTLEINNKLHVPNFLGTYAFDELPAPPREDFSVVVNTEASTEPGDHWLAIVFKKGIFYFMDSFGRTLTSPLFTQEFKKKIKDYFSNYKYKCNHTIIQSILSNTCGYYSIYFIRELQHKTMTQTLQIFGGNFKNNDKLVVDYVSK